MQSTKKLGFGLMRLPQKDGKIDIEAVKVLVDEFIDSGFTYFDTAYCYPGSEEAFKAAVSSRYDRRQYTVATKLAGWLLSETFSPEQMFQEQLERCGVEYFDYYLLHSLQPSRIKDYDNYDCWQFCNRMKSEGKIINYGFSFHGDPILLEELLTKHPEVDFVQLQLNYIDWDDNAAIFASQNYEVARRHGKQIIVMEPVRGGYLANLPERSAAKLSALGADCSQASYAMRFVGALDGVMMVLSGMNTHEQLADNIKTFDNFVPLDEAEQKAIEEVKKSLFDVETVPCTSCRYCTKGCPMNIDIPEIFKPYNMLKIYGEHPRPHLYYGAVISGGSGKASDCIACGQCENACPQHIEIIKQLKNAAGMLDK